MKSLGIILSMIAGALSMYYGGFNGLLAVVMAQIGLVLTIINDL